MRALSGLAMMFLLASCAERETTTNAVDVDNVVIENTEADTNTLAVDNAAAPADDYCEAIDAYVGKVQCARLTDQKHRLSEGIAAFNPPTKMTVGKPMDLTLALGKKADAERVDAALNTPAPTTVRVHVAAKLGRYMRATLTGGAFDIKPLTPEQQDLGADRFGIWTWHVTPKEAGDQPLQLSVEAEAVGLDGQPTRIALASQQITIHVGVTGVQRAEEGIANGTSVLTGLEGLLLKLAAVVAAAGGVWLALRRFGKGKPGPEAGKKDVGEKGGDEAG
ncbi:hypothetical protein [Sphingomonas sp.]|uniref:hypothetical protein n=1 Tax=Sphingomonas sp. TaxID=28214 RepID=UPI001B2587EF|nr:hypothetical protein [Sphingomonas sp.]MBO9713796.1 hypothetical protein [Sphingomonas sp.]